jgi:glycine/D-amino acid oxidase-like deaminating enzyme
MDLKSGYPYWAVKNGLMHAFPALERDLRCDVAVVGGGVSGALVANELAAHGFEVAVLEQRDIAWGSTAASTALLQYEIDTHLTDLARMVGEDDAVRAYRACAEAIGTLEDVSRGVKDVGFARTSSLYFASRPWHRTALHEEFAMRLRHGLAVQWLDRPSLRERTGIRASGAILSATAARIDPYRLANRLLHRLRRAGTAVHDRTCITRIEPASRSVMLHTDSGACVRAKHVVMAAGYASQGWLDTRVAHNSSSYAFVSDPLPHDALGPLANLLVWESARPYFYCRSTDDDRLIVGGEDDAIDIPARRDRRVERKARKLLARTQRLFPYLALKPAFLWAGTFAETADGLPFFGPHPQYGPRVLFAMAYGGNGITYAMIGAQLMRALIERRAHPLQALFGFGRLER